MKNIVQISACRLHKYCDELCTSLFSTLSGRIFMVSDLDFFFFLVRFYLKVHKATSTADSLEPESAVDGTKTHLDCLLK